MLKSVAAAVTGIVLGGALLFVAVPSSATPTHPSVIRPAGADGPCC